MLIFFGRLVTDKLDIHKELFLLSYHSNGAINHDIAYNLPVPLRYFYLKLLNEEKKKEAEAYKGKDVAENPSKHIIKKPF